MIDFLVRKFVRDYDKVQDVRVRQRYGNLASCIGVLCNLLLFSGKFVVGTLFQSVAITADAVNNLSDAGSSLISLVSFRLSSRPADSGHPFGHARIEYLSLIHISFGATCRLGSSPEQDENLKALLAANTPAVAVFGKCWDFHVTDILRATLEENLKIISNTVAYLKANGREVIFDAEHFFDGYKHSPDYALAALRAAAQAGADWVCLCDTNGGSFPHEIVPAVRAALSLIHL